MSNVATYLAKEALKDGNEVTFRAMHPDDRERLVEAFAHLQPRTIRTRFFYPKKALGDDDLRWLDEIGRGIHVGLAATVPSACDELIIGEGSYAALGDSAETGFTVAEAWQGRGIASRLLQHLAHIARDQGIRQFEAWVLNENAPMLAVFRRSGLPMRTRHADGLLHVTLRLDSKPVTPRSAVAAAIPSPEWNRSR
jgi:GNAT superfamily N-acetyltransferase